MKFLPLIWAALWRKKARTIFTLLSILVAFLLFGMLQGVNAAFNATIDRANVNRLMVASSTAFTESLPYSFKAQIEHCLLYTSPSPRDRTRSRMPSSA